MKLVGAVLTLTALSTMHAAAPDGNGNGGFSDANAAYRLTAAALCFHPADLNHDHDIDPGEMSGYTTCFLQACIDWAGGGPLPPPASYASSAGTLFLRGDPDEEDYCCDPALPAPFTWREPGTSGCLQCGDNSIGGTEVCDGTDLGGETCGTQGFDGGTLACNGTCDGFDTSGCF